MKVKAVSLNNYGYKATSLPDLSLNNKRTDITFSGALQNKRLSKTFAPAIGAMLLSLGIRANATNKTNGQNWQQSDNYPITSELVEHMDAIAKESGGSIPADKMFCIWSLSKVNRILPSEKMRYGIYERLLLKHEYLKAVDTIIKECCDDKSLGGSNVVQIEQEIIKKAVADFEKNMKNSQ